nr:hypothetical protein Q903MT_gene6319 [Picea sitchensis]
MGTDLIQWGSIPPYYYIMNCGIINWPTRLIPAPLSSEYHVSQVPYLYLLAD